MSSFTIRDLTLKNRIVVSPMCQYSAIDGVAGDWHLVHLGRFALGGAALVFVEATGVEARGRISPGDVGLWNDDQARALARIAEFLKANGAHARDSAGPCRPQGLHAPALGRGRRAQCRGRGQGRGRLGNPGPQRHRLCRALSDAQGDGRPPIWPR